MPLTSAGRLLASVASQEQPRLAQAAHHGTETTVLLRPRRRPHGGPSALGLRPRLRGCRLVAALRFPEVRQSTKHEVDGTLAPACAASATPFASSRTGSAPRHAQIRRAPSADKGSCRRGGRRHLCDRRARRLRQPVKFSGDGGFEGATTAELYSSRRLDYGGTATYLSQDGETATPSTRPPSRVATPFGERRGVLRTPL